MKKLIVLLVVQMVVAAGFAQQYGGGNAAGSTASLTNEKDGKISGVVVDAENSQPVEFATIALMKAGTETPVDGTVCDEKGKFTINNIGFGSYKIIISFIGYETQTIDNVAISGNNKNVNMGTIKLANSTKVLSEVVVEGQKSVIEERVDRTIYNAENDQTTKGGDASDVLKRVPMLSVDLDGNVTMRGSSNIRVLINNKPSTIMASSVADALKQIPADQIKSVEVITSPSAKYDAEGSAGIINIITKKNTLQGLTLSVDAGVGLRGSNLGLNGNYRKKKMGFSLGGWGRANYNVNGAYENNQITYANFDSLAIGSNTVNIQRADTRNQGLFGNYTFGWDYDINDKNFITASVRFGARNGKNYQDDLYSTFTRNQTDVVTTSTQLQDVMTKNYSNSVDANLSFTHLYETPSKELSFLAGYSRDNRDSDFDRFTREVNEEVDPSGTRNKNNSVNEELTLQLDYQTPIGDNQMLEIGVKDIVRKAVSDFETFSDPEGNGSYVKNPDALVSNNLNYDQNVASGYLSYTLSLTSGYSIKVGSRYEYTTIKAYTLTEDDIDIPAYGALVPSVNISRKFKNGKTVKAAYNRRIQRPSIRFLNPNVQQGNQYDVSYGNPSLDPEYTNNYELSYSTFIKGTSLNFSAFWRNTNNGIQDIRKVAIVNDTIQRVETTYENIGQEDAVGLNVFANVNIGKLMLNGGSDIYYMMLDNNLPVTGPEDPNRQSSASNEGWVMSYRLFGSYNLTKGWGFQFFGFYRGRQVQLQGTQGGFGIYSLGLKKDFNNKKGSVGFGVENFLTKEFKMKNELTSPLVQRHGETTLRNSSVRINISYRIGKMSVDAKPRRRRSINNDDLKDGGDAGGMDNSAGGNGNVGGGQRTGGSTGNVGPQRTATAPVKTAPVDPTAVVKPEGKWSYTIESPQGGEGTLTITKEGEVYSGTIFNKRFNSETKLTEVKVNGNEMSFSYDVSFGGNSMTIVVNGTITGDAYTGNMAVGQFGTFPMLAKRIE